MPNKPRPSETYSHDCGEIIFPDGSKHFVADLDATSCPSVDGIEEVVAELNRLTTSRWSSLLDDELQEIRQGVVGSIDQGMTLNEVAASSILGELDAEIERRGI